MKALSLLLALSPAFACLLFVPGCQTKEEPLPVEPPAVTPDAAAVRLGGLTAGAGTVGMISTGSGLKYRVLASGPASGRSPTLSDSVTVHYRGTLADGTVFDSSYDRGQPVSFRVSEVIPGWTEALQRMKPGDKWRLYIPARLAYGPNGMGDQIPPNSDLFFLVELLEIQ